MRLRLGHVAGLAALVLASEARADDAAALGIVRDLCAVFGSTVKDGVPSLTARVDALGPALDRAFDFPAMARVAVGQRWSGFTPDQQAAVTDALRRSMTVTYANRIGGAAGGRFDVAPAVETRGSQRVVPTRVTTADGDESEVDFVVNAGDRVQDILLNGDVSEIAAQRTALGAPLKAGGAEAAVNFLRERADEALAAKQTP